eukprot:11166030-Lingulodinium_polyedra.AAC.1
MQHERPERAEDSPADRATAHHIIADVRDIILGAQVHTVLENKRVSTAHKQQAAELCNVHSNAVLPNLNIGEKGFQ